MNFSKDLLIVDIEATGLQVAKHEIIQLAAILLDKKTLKEKAAFSTFVKPIHWNVRQKEAMEVNNITWDSLKYAPPLSEVVLEFKTLFPSKNTIIANYGGILDITFLRAAFEKNKLVYPYHHSVFNIWALCFAYMAQHGKFTNKKKFPGFGLEDLAKKFKLDAQTHDALDDCRLEAAVLRRILKVM